MKKIFVLDTNVILHDATCIFHFQENDIVIPITVIEEIDAFKRGQDIIHYNAREFIRLLDNYSGDHLVNGGVSLGPGRGRISILTIFQDEPEIVKAFFEAKTDHRILSAALFLRKKHPKTQVVLVSKDVNLRLKAKSVGLQSQDYYTDKIEDIDKLYRGKRLVEYTDIAVIDKLCSPPYEVPAAEAPVERPLSNEYFIFRSGSRSALAFYHSQRRMFTRIEKVPAYGITPRNAEQIFAVHALLDPEIQLVTLSGKAGTGKTLLALAAALECRKQYRQIFLARPIVALSNKDLGYLPGDIESKLDPYMQPLYDNLGVIRNQYPETDERSLRIQEMLDNGKLEIAPLAYIRGRSLNHIYFIVDEAQNLTPHEVKTIITRCGAATKIILTGDPHQIDNPYVDAASNGLSIVAERFKHEKIAGHVTLTKGERSVLADRATELL